MQIYCIFLDGRKTLLVQRSSDDEDDSKKGEFSNIRKLNFQAKGDRRANKYVLQFFHETDEEIKIRKEEARHSLKKGSDEDLEIDGNDYFPSDLQFPQRPVWSFDMSPTELDRREQRYFTVNI